MSELIKYTKRILAVFLAVSLVLTLFPAGALATEADMESPGNSVSEDIQPENAEEDPDITVISGDQTVELTEADEVISDPDMEPVIMETSDDADIEDVLMAVDEAFETEEASEDKNDELAAVLPLTIEAATANFGEAFGNKAPDDIQENIVLNEDGTVSGTLKLVTGWTQFGTELSSGHYIALHVDDGMAAKIEVGIGETAEENWRLHDIIEDPDRTIILRVANKDEQSIKVKISYERGKAFEKVYDLSELVLDDFRIDTEIGADTNLL
ncbi:MAG: hypothetical protein K5886_00305, partial [Lachnospiraceae bacterium]|nr:hypothetical protein [Lachnospiraceae bacterium]